MTNQILSDVRVVYSKSSEESGKRISELNRESSKSSKTDSIFKDGSLNVHEITCEKKEALNHIAHPNEAEKTHSDFCSKHAETQNTHVTSKQQDCPKEREKNKGEQGVTTASWLGAPPSFSLQVIFNPLAEAQMKLFSQDAEKDFYR